MPAYADIETSERFEELLYALVDDHDIVDYVDVADATIHGWLVREGEAQIVTFEMQDGSTEQFFVEVKKVER